MNYQLQTDESCCWGDCSRPRAAMVTFRTENVHMVRETDALVSAGYHVEVLCLQNDHESKPQPRRHVSFATVVIDRHRGNLARYALSYVRWFLLGLKFLTLGRLRRRHSLVVINSLPDHQVFAALVPKLLGTPVVLFLKEPASLLFGSVFEQAGVATVMARIEMWAIAFADHTFVVTEDHKDFYVQRGADASRLSVVVNSAPSHLFPQPEIDAAARADDDVVTVISPGTIEPRWGHDIMLRALAKARTEVENLRFVLAGSGDEVDRVLALAEELGVDDIVDYVGLLNLDELADHYRHADIGITAQVHSPYAQLVHTMKMYEFMLSGVAVISSRMRSTMNYFDDEAVTYFDGVDELAAAIISLATDSCRRTTQVRRATEAFAPYRWEVQEQHYLGAIDRVVTANR